MSTIRLIWKYQARSLKLEGILNHDQKILANRCFLNFLLRFLSDFDIRISDFSVEN